ncbi:RtcB family protein [Corallincola platygyrae]|uniref:3'-phosphate/5'-hydroxy nucleic acid ligase n=1 Tax=Corallincola platygyrae TaxID=1193278 RepID=A0ABW4XSB0_9GAMM
MPIKKILNGNGKDVPVKIYTDTIDHGAINQLKNIAKLPIIHSHIAAMPDVHMGIGATVGSVIPTLNAIIPAAVGVDIGCGMNAVRLSIKASQLPDHLKPLREAIERAVPVGAGAHSQVSARAQACKPLEKGLAQLFERHPTLLKMLRQPHATWVKQMGTLGSGNHFIELCVDESDDVWIMLHSGSRGIGNAIGRYFIQQAKRDMQGHMQHLPDKDLAYFSEGSPHFNDYVVAVNWAQEYARVNRQEMMGLVLRAIAPHLPEFDVSHEAINCHHNYVQQEFHYGEQVFVTRKGAISARQDELGIIPGSMGTRSYIVRGKGSEESFCSCSHGAGRVMSRGKAKQLFSRKDLEEQTRGVECRKDKGVLDEIPGAYKDIDQVMAHQNDLVEVVHTLKQLVCVKG